MDKELVETQSLRFFGTGVIIHWMKGRVVALLAVLVCQMIPDNRKYARDHFADQHAAEGCWASPTSV
jgi:hypothetical protein